jgi:DNA-binding beta-propeller fold protein YncE
VKKQFSVMLEKLHLVKLAVVATVLCGLATVLPQPPLLGQNGIATLAQRLAFPPGGVTSSTLNALQLSILHWENADQTASFAVGFNPTGLAFDGLHIWVTNQLSGTVTELRAPDGLTFGPFAVGSHPVGVAIDGANIWVANSGSGTVTKLQAYGGKTLGTFTVGALPNGVAFDGANI